MTTEKPIGKHRRAVYVEMRDGKGRTYRTFYETDRDDLMYVLTRAVIQRDALASKPKRK